MGIDRAGRRGGKVAVCVDAAPVYRLSEAEAPGIVDRQVETIESDWDEICQEAGMTQLERRALCRRQLLNPSAFETV